MHERRINRVAIIGAGDMGSSVPAELIQNGFDVTTCLSGAEVIDRAISQRKPACRR